MENNENLVAEQENVPAAENVVVPTEQSAENPTQPKLYTQEEVDGIVGNKKARWDAKNKRDYDRKYEKHNQIVEMLKAGTGKDNVDDLISHLQEFYSDKKVEVASTPVYPEREIEILAQADAEEIIKAGYDEVVEEVDRLADIGVEKMTAREKATFKVLADHRYHTERIQALAEIGVPESVYNSPEFKTFASQFTANVPITDVYGIYEKNTKTSDVEPMGSMKNGSQNEEKTYYSPEDVDKLTASDYDNPTVLKRVRESMLKWPKKK